MRYEDLTGRKFGRLTVLERVENDKGGNVCLLCRCDCGTVKKIRRSHVVGGKIVSCGCYIRELASTLHRTHHMTGSRLYGVWSNMKTRCYNKSNRAYKDYGGRGIKICDEWLDFENFYNWAIANGYDENAEHGECTIERADVNGDYDPSNCRFITIEEQAANKRSNVILNFNGKSQTLAQWSRETGIDQDTLSARLKRGYSVEDALTKSTDIYKYYATFNGITKPVKEWCEEMGMPYKTVAYRVKHGMKPEEALTTPIGGIRHYDESNRTCGKMQERSKKL